MRLLILAAVLTLAYGHTPCPPLWTHFKGNCFRLFPDRLRAIDAKTTCNQFAPCSASALGQLAKIQDVETNDFLRMYVDGFVGTPPGINVWTGGSDAPLEGQWRWADGTAFTFLNWALRQPDNGAQSTGQPENCMLLSSETGVWSDASCAMMNPYVCMMPAEQERQLFPGRPFNPGFNPGYNPGYNPGFNPQNPNQPGNPRGNPNQPGGNPNIPGGNPNVPGRRPI